MGHRARVQYTTCDGHDIAYAIVGEGPFDVVFNAPSVSHLETTLDDEGLGWPRLARCARVILFDKRGTGLADRIGRVGTLEERVDDMRAVMDAAGSSRADLVGIAEGGAMAVLFAATHPDRVRRLVLWASFARRRITADDAVDVRSVCNAVHQPTLIVHRADDPVVPIAGARDLAERIGQARFVVLPGAFHLAAPGTDHSDEDALDTIEEFLTERPLARKPDRFLAAVMFTDIVDSTSMLALMGDACWKDVLDHYDRLVAAEVRTARGEVIRSTGDGSLAVFDGPARAVRCALALCDKVRRLGMDLRVGIHVGEIERRANDLAGLAVHIAARVAAQAEGGQVLVSRAVRDLVAGSGLDFQDRGEHDLKGVPDTWTLWEARDR